MLAALSQSFYCCYCNGGHTELVGANRGRQVVDPAPGRQLQSPKIPVCSMLLHSGDSGGIESQDSGLRNISPSNLSCVLPFQSGHIA